MTREKCIAIMAAILKTRQGASLSEAVDDARILYETVEAAESWRPVNETEEFTEDDVRSSEVPE